MPIPTWRSDGGLAPHMAALGNLAACFARLAEMPFPPYGWIYGEDRDAADTYIGGRTGAFLASPEFVLPSPGRRLADAIDVARGSDAAQVFVRRIRAPMDALDAWERRCVKATGSPFRNEWRWLAQRAESEEEARQMISDLDTHYQLTRRVFYDSISYVNELAASVPVADAGPIAPANRAAVASDGEPARGSVGGAAEGVQAPRRAAISVRIEVDEGSFEDASGTPKNKGRVRIRVTAADGGQKEHWLARVQFDAVQRLEVPRRIDLGTANGGRQLAARLLKTLARVGVRARRPEGGRPGEVELIDQITITMVNLPLDQDRALRRFENRTRGQQMRGAID